MSDNGSKFQQKWKSLEMDKTLRLCEKMIKSSGPGRSKLTMSLVNISLKFQMLLSQICQYFLSKKCEECKSFSHFYKNNSSVFGYKVVKQLTC